MKQIILISKYLGLKGDAHIFHFKGFYDGMRIDEVRISDGEFLVREDYVLYIRVAEVEDGILFGHLIKFKPIFT